MRKSTMENKLSFALVIPALIFGLSVVSAPVLAMESRTNAEEITKGKIVKIDEKRRRVKITHGELKQFNMRPMTMYFGVTGSTDLNKFNEDDEVQFELKRGRDRTLRIMAMCTIEEGGETWLTRNEK